MSFRSELIDIEYKNEGYNTEQRKAIITEAIASGELKVGSDVSLFVDPYGPRGTNTVTVVGPDKKQIGNLTDAAARKYFEAVKNEEVLNTTIIRIDKNFANDYSIEISAVTDPGWTAASDDVMHYQYYGETEWDYEIEADGSARIIKYHGPKAYIIIVPTSLKGHPVRYFGLKKAENDEGNGVFAGYHMIGPHIVFPDEIIEFGESALDGCWASSFNTPSKLKKIGALAFCEMRGIDEFVIPSTVEELGEAAFYGSDFKKIQILAHIDTLPDSLFRNCRDLETVELRVPIKKIGARVFLQSGISRFAIPKSVTEIGFAAFAICDNLTYLVIPASVQEIGDRAFEKSEQVKISVYENSFAERWAQENGVQHTIYCSDGSVKQGKAGNIPGLITPAGPRWNGIYRGSLGLRQIIYLRFWDNNECISYIEDVMDFKEYEKVLEHLEQPQPMYSNHFTITGENITVRLEYEDGYVNLFGTVGFGGNSMELQFYTEQGPSDPISLSFEKVDLDYGKQIGFYRPEAHL